MKPENLPGIPEQDLRSCAGCSKPILASGGLTFWMGTIFRGIIDPQAVQERVGLSMMMGGSQALASAFSSRPIARQFDGPFSITVCEHCACTMPLAALALEGTPND